MTKDDIMRMAQEAGFADDKGTVHSAYQLEAFANLVAAHKAEIALAEAYRCGYEAGAGAEREECAKWLDFYDGPNCRRAEAIRARTTS